MPSDPDELEQFHDRPFGRRVATIIAGRLRPMLGRRSNDRILVLGYGTPYLAGLATACERLCACVLPGQSARPWPASGAVLLVQADERALPFTDALFDLVLCIHGLEYFDTARAPLREIWRVLAPAGRLVVVAPNRLSPWTLFDATPFGNGRPYGRQQLTRLLRDQMFEPAQWDMALVLPPLGPLARLEGVARWLLPELAGVHIVAARKIDGLSPTGLMPAQPATTLAARAL